MQMTSSTNPVDAAAGRSVYDTFVRIHAEQARFTHSTIMFMIWHREFVYQFETALQQFDSRVTLPYWDWTLDWATPHDSPIFDANLFGGANYGTINSGAFTNLVSNYPSRHFVLRFLRTGREGGSNAGFRTYDQPAVLRQLIDDGSLTFESYAAAVENMHAAPHILIGGTNLPTGSNFGELEGDLVFTDRSPADPIFYMIHGGVDKFLQARQQAFPGRADEYDLSNPNAVNSILPGLGVSVNAAMFKSCVIYEEPTRRAQTTSRMVMRPSTLTVSSHVGLGQALDENNDVKILKDVLKVSNAMNDGNIAMKAYAINAFCNLNRISPVPLMKGLKLVEEARMSVFKPEKAAHRSGLVRLKEVDVDERAIEELFQEVKKREMKQVTKYYASTAKKPYMGYKGPGANRARSGLDSKMREDIFVEEDSPYWRA